MYVRGTVFAPSVVLLLRRLRAVSRSEAITNTLHEIRSANNRTAERRNEERTQTKHERLRTQNNTPFSFFFFFYFDDFESDEAGGGAAAEPAAADPPEVGASLNTFPKKLTKNDSNTVPSGILAADPYIAADPSDLSSGCSRAYVTDFSRSAKNASTV